MITIPVVEDRFWIIKDDYEVSTLRLHDNNKFLLSNSLGITIFDEKSDVIDKFGSDFFEFSPEKIIPQLRSNECHGFPTDSEVYNPVFDLKRKIPMYSKGDNNKTLFCAGFYWVKFDNGWKRTFCPKEETLDQFKFIGPFKDEKSMKGALSNAT
jgi:hypothetical protein